MSKSSKGGKLNRKTEKNRKLNEPAKATLSGMTKDCHQNQVRVLIHKIESPESISVSLFEDECEFQKMNKQMQKFYGSKTVCRMNKKFERNVIYSVWSRKDKKYSRAQIISEPERDSKVVKMLLVDLAEEEDIQVELIQPLAPQFLHASKHIFKIQLAGIKPCNETISWSKSSCEELKSLINETRDAEYYINSADSNDLHKPMSVDLFIKRRAVIGPLQPDKKEILSVAHYLLNARLALPTTPTESSEAFKMELEEKRKLYKLANKGLTVDVGNLICKQDGHLVQDTLYDSSDADFDWIPADYIPQKTIDAIPTHVDGECHVFFHPVEKKKNLDAMLVKLQQYYNNTDIEAYDSWKPGDVCIAKYCDGNWYRAKVLKVEKNFVKVHLLDYGDEVYCKKVGKLVKGPIIMKEVPILSTKAKIAGIYPEGEKWNTRHIEVIRSCIVDKICKIKPVGSVLNPWTTVSVWLVMGKENYPSLQWTLKNKYGVPCKFDNITYYMDDENKLKGK